MNSQRNEGPETVAKKTPASKAWIILLAVLLIAGLALAPTLLGQADAGGARGHAFDVSFTKWVTTAPNMEGVVGGDVGAGTFAGQIQSMSTDNGITKIGAIYNVNGSLHSFTASIKAVQDDTAGTGSITGTVTSGWLNGMALTGEYKVEAQCPIDTPQTAAYYPMCFQGTLHILPGP